MRFRVDISQGEGAQRNAVALHMDLPGEREAFVVAEVGRSDKASIGLLQAALSALTGTLACPDPAESPQRQLDSAFQAANRLVYTRKIQNPAVDDLLVSAAVVLVSQGSLAVANSGTTTVFLRTQEVTVGITTPEHAAARLGEHGLTGKAPLDEKSLAPVNGLGLPNEVFKLKQQKTMEEPLQYELVLVGSQVLAKLTPADIHDAIQSKDRELPTADRVYQLYTSHMGAGSCALSARRLTVSQPSWHTVPEHVPSNVHLAWGPIALGAFGILVLVGLIYVFLPPETRTQFDKPKERDIPARIRPVGSVDNLIEPTPEPDLVAPEVEAEPPAPVIGERPPVVPPQVVPPPAEPQPNPLLQVLEQKASDLLPSAPATPATDEKPLPNPAAAKPGTKGAKGAVKPGAKPDGKKGTEKTPPVDEPVDEISDGPVQVIDFSDQADEEKEPQRPKIREKKPPKPKEEPQPSGKGDGDVTPAPTPSEPTPGDTPAEKADDKPADKPADKPDASEGAL